MSFENLKAGIVMLMDQMSETPEDAHQMQELLREKLSELRGYGLPLPQDLVELEQKLEADLVAKS
ncbi:MAG: hypothetical protein GXP05_07080 [Alphaproteobacteria bacterium]|nr:hypothetical protein [Alphaproteobacteria bacterium]